MLGLLPLLLLCASARSEAQTPVSGTSKVVFTASSDHNAKDAAGVNIVASYQVDTIGMNPAGAIGFSTNIGKPTPDGSNTITQTLAQFGALPFGNVYTLTVGAVGPGGTTKSAASASFTRPFPPTPAPAAPGVPSIVP